MKKHLLFLLLAVCSTQLFAQGHLISHTLFKTVTKDEYRAVLKKRHVPKSLAPSRYTVDVYDITYYTKWHDGSTIKASGLCFVPRNAKEALPTVVYHHGTRLEKGRSQNLNSQDYLCLGMAMDGYVVIEPDYIGLGEGDKFHLYQVASSMGQATVDMLFALRDMEDTLGMKSNGQLFLTGYSEGGYGALAAQKLIEDKYSDQFHVTASSPMSGAYAMSTVMSQVMFHNYPRPHYLPYLLHSYNEVYHFVSPDINVAYKAPYDTIIPKLFDGTHGYAQIDKVLPHVPKDMLKDTFVNMFISQPNFPFKVALKENDLDNWLPKAPVQLCYCDSDHQVSCQNALVAYKNMRALGAKHVTLRDAGKRYDHGGCAVFASLYTKMYFDSFRKGSKYGRKGPAGKRFMVSLAKMIVNKQMAKHKHHENEG
ncbi:MAG TPA: lipase family protein [Chitinophagales bacterium]|nr:lipase family protein [Chitinophagales bacterium]